MSAMQHPAKNTDRELWRESDGDYYSPSLHVTESGAIGMNVGGSVIVMRIRDWHALARQLAEAQQRIAAAEIKLERCHRYEQELTQEIRDEKKQKAQLATRVRELETKKKCRR